MQVNKLFLDRSLMSLKGEERRQYEIELKARVARQRKLINRVKVVGFVIFFFLVMGSFSRWFPSTQTTQESVAEEVKQRAIYRLYPGENTDINAVFTDNVLVVVNTDAPAVLYAHASIGDTIRRRDFGCSEIKPGRSRRIPYQLSLDKGYNFHLLGPQDHKQLSFYQSSRQIFGCVHKEAFRRTKLVVDHIRPYNITEPIDVELEFFQLAGETRIYFNTILSSYRGAKRYPLLRVRRYGREEKEFQDPKIGAVLETGIEIYEDGFLELRGDAAVLRVEFAIRKDGKIQKFMGRDFFSLTDLERGKMYPLPAGELLLKLNESLLYLHKSHRKYYIKKYDFNLILHAIVRK